jgi:hypothetical protein
MSLSENFVEARELAHEVVEPAHAGGELAQREEEERARRGCPQKEREMREIPALGEGADEIGHDETFVSVGKAAKRRARAGRVQ